MARPRKYRNICGFPTKNRFGSLDMEEYENKFIIMAIDQYETIRLIDLEGLTQEECADQMNIARTTVQRIYSEARKNLAHALVEGKVLKIEGGDYKLCNGKGKFCGRGNCHRNRFDSDLVGSENGIDKNIEIIVGASGDSKTVVKDYLTGKLKSTGFVCHEHQHHGKC